jgi:hypothetical protein
MPMRFVAVVLLLLLNCLPGEAGGRGGHRTSFDPNSYGGGWTCFRTQASGACGSGPFVQYFDASCSGLAGKSADDAALASWHVYGLSLGDALAKLNMGDGSDCWFTPGPALIQDGDETHASIKNSIIWGYGATVHDIAVQVFGTVQLGTNDAKIQTASAGATTATLVNGADNTKFTVNSWVLISGLALQNFGFPLNPQFFEWNYITNIAGSTITFLLPLQNTYSSGWPDLGTGCSGNCGGPAWIFQSYPGWDASAQVFGLTFQTSNGAGIAIAGRQMQFTDVNFPTGTGPSQSKGLWFSFVNMPSVEADKTVEYLNLYRVYGGQIQFQSSSINNVDMISNTWSIAINGLPKNISMVDTRAPGGNPSIFVGPTGYGHGVNATIDGSFFASKTIGTRVIPINQFSYSDPTLTIANASGSAPNAWAMGVPGQKYYFSPADSTDNSSPHTVFTITAVRYDATNTYWDTDLGAVLPTPTCGGGPCTHISPYPMATIKQINTPAGGQCVTGYAPTGAGTGC